MQYLTIQQVSQITGIPPHTLRFWEKEFEGILAPSRTKGGQRRYNGEDISIIEQIKELREDGIGLSWIRGKLKNKDGDTHFDTAKIDGLAKRVGEIVRAEVYNFFQGDKL